MFSTTSENISSVEIMLVVMMLKFYRCPWYPIFTYDS